MARRTFWLSTTLLISTLSNFTLGARVPLHVTTRVQFSPLSLQEHYSALLAHYRQKDWAHVVEQGEVIKKYFIEAPLSNDASFYLGVGFFHLADFFKANHYLSDYLQHNVTSKLVHEAMEYKFAIAENYSKGARNPLFGVASLPRLVPAQEEALVLYDEVVAALPSHHPLVAKALWNKGILLLQQNDYREGIEVFETLIRKFPNSPLAIESYIEINRAYLLRANNEYPDNDFLELAEINLKKFQHVFSIKEKVDEACELFIEMQEIYAKHLYELGRFYERTGKNKASTLYYNRILSQFGATKSAREAAARLEKMRK